jgi:hypothetical protein
LKRTRIPWLRHHRPAADLEKPSPPVKGEAAGEDTGQIGSVGQPALLVISGRSGEKRLHRGPGYSADGDYSPRSWLIHRTKITKGAAAAHLVWARRAAAHPQVLAALAERAVSESYARKICEWSDKLPAECRDAADAILVAGARAGADLVGLVELAAEMCTRSVPEEDCARRSWQSHKFSTALTRTA